MPVFLYKKKDIKDAGFSDVSTLDSWKTLNEGLFKKTGNTTEADFKEAIKEFEKLISKFKSLKSLKLNGFKPGVECFKKIFQSLKEILIKVKKVAISYSIVFECDDYFDIDDDSAIEKVDAEFYRFAKSLKFTDIYSNYKNGVTANQSDEFKWCGIMYTFDSDLVLTCYIKKDMRKI